MTDADKLARLIAVMRQIARSNPNNSGKPIRAVLMQDMARGVLLEIGNDFTTIGMAKADAAQNGQK